MKVCNALLLVSLCAAPACVLDPIWGDEPTRRDPIDFSGMASRTSAPVRIQAWNHGASAFETVASFTGGTRRYASEPDIFGWSRVNVRLADRYWVPPGAPCQTGGMANLRVQEQNSDGSFTDLATFDEAGEECLYDSIADGDHPVAAGNACKRDQATIVLFAPPQCVPAAASDPTPPAVTVRIANATQAYQRNPGEGAASYSGISRTSRLSAMSLVRDLNGAVSRADVVGSYTVTCRRTTDGTLYSYPSPISSRTTRTVTPGVLADIAIETTWLIDVPSIVASGCASGYTFHRLAGSITAHGTNAAGTVASSSLLSFTI
jgi:hypothetical protein